MSLINQDSPSAQVDPVTGERRYYMTPPRDKDFSFQITKGTLMQTFLLVSAALVASGIYLYRDELKKSLDTSAHVWGVTNDSKL